MGFIKKFQCQHCQGIVETEFDDDYVICGHCESACQVPKEFGPGVVIDDFVVAKLLGEGGMGNVYLAHQFSLDRKVALKILKDDFLKDPKFKDEFIYEARNVACLNHPNIIQAYKVGEENGMVFFAMEYVEGRNLQDILKEDGAITEKLALSIAMEIVSALGYGWDSRKLVHRDIKPENIMICSDGTAKLMDLGLSLRDGDDKDDGDTIAGTPQYISPEQILGTEMDIRGDFYCLGATLYHLVSGKLPFEGSLKEIIKKHLAEKPKSLRKVAPHVNSFFAKIIHKMMSKKPEDRYDSAKSLLNAFQKDMQIIIDEEHGKKHFKVNTQTNIKTATNSTERVQRKKKKDPLVIASLVMLGILIGGFFIIRLFMSGGSQPSPVEETVKTEVASSGAGSHIVSQPVEAEDQALLPDQGLYVSMFNIKMDDKNRAKELGLVKIGERDYFNARALTPRKDFYKLLYEGYITLPYSETYLFHLKADDSVTLFIGNRKVGSAGGNGGSFTKMFDKGTYPIRVEYLQHTAAKSINIEVESISVNRTKLPKEWLTKSAEVQNIELDESKPGLDYAVYTDMESFAGMSTRPPDKSGTISDLKTLLAQEKGKYVASFNGILKLPKAGRYTFYLKSHNRSHVYFDDILKLDHAPSFDNDCVREIQFMSELAKIEIDYSQKGGKELLDLEIEGEGLPRQSIPAEWFFINPSDEFLVKRKSTIDREKADALTKSDKKGELQFEVFNKPINELRSMRNMKPDKAGVTANLASGTGGLKENFGLRFTGKIDIPITDNYMFQLDSDDTCDVFIKGKKIVGDRADGQVKTGTVYLEKGKHDIEVLYQQGGGDKKLKLWLKSSQIPLTRVPSHWFSLPDGTSAKEPETTINEKGRLNYKYYETTYKDNVEDIVKEPVVSEGTEANLNYRKGRRDEFYGLYFYGFIDIPEKDDYTFHLSSDDLGLLKIAGKEITRDTAAVGVGQATVSLGKGQHKFELYYYQVSKPGHLTLEVESKNIKKQRVPSSWFSTEESAEADSGYERGLKYTVYKNKPGMKSLDEMAGSEVIVNSQECPNINFDTHSKKYEENFGVVYDGYFYSEEDDTFTLSLTSNDGSRLYIEDKLLIDHDGNHPSSEKVAEVSLKKGFHKFRLEYFQGIKDKELIFKLKNKSGKMIKVPAKHLYRKK